MHEFSDDPYRAPETASRSDMSCAAKVLLIFFGGGLLCGALCCGGLFLYPPFWFSEETGKITALQAEMLDLDIPDEYRPVVGLNMFYGFMRMAVYVDTAEEGMLMLVDVAEANFGGREQFAAQMRGEIEKNINQRNLEPLRLLSGRTETFEVRGEPVEFQVEVGEGIRSGVEYHEYSGVVDGATAGRAVLLYLRAPSDSTDEAEFRAMLESIR